MRYDLIWNAFAQNVTFEPFEKAQGSHENANNLQPRAGFAYQLNDKDGRSAAGPGCTTTTS